MYSSTGPPSRGPSSPSGEPPPSGLQYAPAFPPASSQNTETSETLPGQGSFVDSGAYRHEQRRLGLDAGTRWSEVPLEQWLLQFVPGEPLPSAMIFKPFEVEFGGLEHKMYPGLNKGLNRVLETVGWTDHEVLTTSRLPDLSAPVGILEDGAPNMLCPDLGLYPKTAESHDRLHGTHSHSPGARVAWNSAEILIEVKRDARQSPFSSRRGQRSAFLPLGRERRLARGQLAEYGLEAFNHQHRHAFYMILFVRECARLLRFDRAGVVVSSEFDYIAHPEVIGTFLFRMARFSPEQRGHDPSAVRASPPEDALFRSLHKLFPEGSAKERGLRNAASEGWPAVRLTVNAPFSDGSHAICRGTLPSQRQFLVGKPSSTLPELVGRGTRGFVAYDLLSEQVVFIKDTWRFSSNDTQTEFDIYLRLREETSGELYIPTLLGGGDVLHEGRIQQTFNDSLVHSRLIFREICRPLEDFTNSFELVKAVTWALVAHSKAWKQCGILHRGVSARSIMIYDTTDSGLPDPVTTIRSLADWEYATQQTIHDPGGPKTPVDVVLWPFVSARLQEYPEKSHELADDLESFMHVLNYCTLKHLPNAPRTRSDEELAYLIKCIYDVVPSTTYQPLFMQKRSPLKVEKVQNGTPFVQGLPVGHPMDPLLVELSRSCKLHYELTSCLPALPPSSMEQACAADSIFGLQSVPDYHGSLKCDEDEAHVAPQSISIPQWKRREDDLSPLKNHDVFVMACMRALRTVWPRADKLERPRVGHRLVSSRRQLGTSTRKRRLKESSIDCLEGRCHQRRRKAL